MDWNNALRPRMSKSDVLSLLPMPRPGTIRILCLLIFAVGLALLCIGAYIDQYRHQLCTDDAIQQLVQRMPRHTDTQRQHDNYTQQQQQQQDSGWDYDWDSLARENGKDVSGIPDRTLILVRHGQYDLSTGHLTSLGREQAALTGQRLKEANLSYTEIIHSTLDRAAETANIIHESLSTVRVRQDEMLVEGGPIPPLPTITYWQLPDKAYHVDGPRLEAAFRKYFHRPDRSLKQPSFQILVAHGNIFRFFALRALQLSRDAWMRLFIAHASISMIHIRSDGTVSLTKLGDAGHFPLQKVTY